MPSLREPCAGCAAPYGYRNVMPLSTDTYRFAVSFDRQKAQNIARFFFYFKNINTIFY